MFFQMNLAKQLKDLEERMAKLEELMVIRIFVESFPVSVTLAYFPGKFKYDVA